MEGQSAKMRGLRISIFWISLLQVLPSAYAANREAQERAAKRACLTGDPGKGVALLVDLYLDTNDPNWIFNQGRCFEQNNRCEEAIARFREYLRKAKDAGAMARADAEKHIADCQALLGRNEAGSEKSAAAQPTAPAVNPTVPAPPVAPLAAPEAAVAAPIGSRNLEQPGSGLRTAGIVTVSIGAAALIAGTVLNIKYNNTIDDLQSHYNPSTDSSNQTTKTMVLVGYGAGAACVAGGALLYLLGWKAGTATVAPTAVAGNPGAILVGAF